MLRIAVRGEPTTFVDLGPASGRPTLHYFAVGGQSIGKMMPVLREGQPVTDAAMARRQRRNERVKAARRAAR